MKQLLRDELHLHLYGCLTPEDIFELGKDHYKDRADALNWYSAEYSKLTGTSVDWRSYFQSDSGPEHIRKDFLADRPMTFPEFQARFNLIIALLPTITHAPSVLRRVVSGQLRDGLRYAEHRIFVPPVLKKAELATYYLSLAKEAAALNSDLAGQFAVRVILSVSRNPDVFSDQYSVLKDLQSDPDVRACITGIDFCGVEEGFPPENLTGVFSRVLRDNASAPTSALALLYHVGESFDGMSVFSAMRWVHKSASMGAHRLGHAIAIAIAPDQTRRFADGATFTEPRSEAAALLNFLDEHAKIKAEARCNPLRYTYRQALATSGQDPLTITWNPDLRAAAGAMQGIIRADLRSGPVTIETCPTSNRIIGRIESVSALPAFQFAKAGIPFIISSDDPGIFATSLAHEENLCREGGMSHDDLCRAAEYNETRRAGLLAGRGSW